MFRLMKEERITQVIFTGVKWNGKNTAIMLANKNFANRLKCMFVINKVSRTSGYCSMNIEK